MSEPTLPAPSPQVLARRVLAMARARGLKIATAESCTGGMVAMNLTAIAGSSDVVDRGFVTYSNAAKMAMIGVPERLLAAHGAVSAEVAAAIGELGTFLGARSIALDRRKTPAAWRTALAKRT